MHRPDSQDPAGRAALSNYRNPIRMERSVRDGGEAAETTGDEIHLVKTKAPQGKR
jgi:hypothetical protein